VGAGGGGQAGAYLEGWARKEGVMSGLPGLPGAVAWVSAVGEVLRETAVQVLACEKRRAKVWVNTAWGGVPLYVEARALDRRCSAELPW
jgi:hypothetical protein